MIRRSIFTLATLFVVLAMTSLEWRAQDIEAAGGDTLMMSIKGGTGPNPPFGAGNQGNNTSRHGSMSADGRYVVFSSFATNLLAAGGPTDNNFSSDVFIRDTQTNTVQLISVNSAGTAAGCVFPGGGCAGVGGSDSLAPSVSDDGCYVAFISKAADLDSTATDATSAENAFLRFRGGASCGGGAAFTRLLDRDASNAACNAGGPNIRDISIAASGLWVVYSSIAGICPDPADTNNLLDVYLYSVAAQTNTRVSYKDGTVNTQYTTGSVEIATVSSDGCKIAMVGVGDLVTPSAGPQPQAIVRTRNGAAGSSSVPIRGTSWLLRRHHSNTRLLSKMSPALTRSPTSLMDVSMQVRAVRLLQRVST
jgi:hypothetical protein